MRQPARRHAGHHARAGRARSRRRSPIADCSRPRPTRARPRHGRLGRRRRGSRAAVSSRRLGLPVITNGMGRGIVPRRPPLLVTKARSAAFGQCDLAVVVGAPLDFRLGYGRFGGKDGTPPAPVVHIAELLRASVRHMSRSPRRASGDLTLVLDGLRDAVRAGADRRRLVGVDATLQGCASQADRGPRGRAARVPTPTRSTRPASTASCVPHARRRRRGDRRRRRLRVVRRQVRRAKRPLAAGSTRARTDAWVPGSVPRSPPAWSRPSAQIVLLLGDGAAGMSLMDVDTLVRHGLPVVMVVGNNSCWGLEKHPMRFLYGYDVAADLGHETRVRRGGQGARGRG